LLIRRRDAEDLVLTTASRAAQEREASSVAVKMFVALMQHDGQVRELVTDVLPEVFRGLSAEADEVREFVVELVATMRAAESIDTPTPVVQVVESRRHTAEVLAGRPRIGGCLDCTQHRRLWDCGGTEAFRLSESETGRSRRAPSWQQRRVGVAANTATAWYELWTRPEASRLIAIDEGEHERIHLHSNDAREFAHALIAAADEADQMAATTGSGS
jgi:hypothetical protein